MSERGKWVLITGASAGIGEAFAQVFAANGFNLALCARREDKLIALSERLKTAYAVEAHVCPADLSSPESVEALLADLSARQIQVDALVNNAGYGLKSRFSDLQWEEIADFMQVMAMSVTRLCHGVLPGMKARNYGRIINVASLAAFAPESAGSLYTGVKAYMVSMSRAMAQELSGTDIHVTALCPGFTYSEFHDVLGNRDNVSRLPRWMWMDSPTVAQQGYDAVMRGQVVYVNGWANKLLAGVCSLLPHSVLLALGPKKLVDRADLD